MIYELRIYHATPGKLPLLLKRFETITLGFWNKYDIRQVGFWTTLIGESSNDVYFILEWKNLAEREQKWSAFQNDPDWIKARGETEKDGPLTTHMTNLILAPTSFSNLK